jgi:WD40 repeat protein
LAGGIRLDPALAQIEQFFDPAQVLAGRVNGEAVLDLAPAFLASKQAQYVATRAPCHANAQFDATFAGDSWGAAPVVGLVLNHQDGHTDAVNSVAFAPDASLVASGGADAIVVLWEPATGRPRGVCRGHAGAVLAVAFSPDGKVLASGGADNTVRLWDTASGRELTKLPRRAAAAPAVAFSPNGNDLAVPGADGTVEVWDVTARRGRLNLTGHTAPVQALAFSRDGTTLASGGLDRTVRLWDAKTGKPHGSFKDHPFAIGCVAISPDGRYLGATDRQTLLTLWDLKTGRATHIDDRANYITCLAFAPDGARLATGGNRSAVLRTIPNGESIATLDGHVDFVSSLAFSPDGATLATASRDRTVKLWDARKHQLLRSLELRGYQFLVRASLDQLPARRSQPTALTGIDDVLQRGGSLRLQILRNGTRLLEQPMRPLSGALRLRARRRGNTLSFQVNDLPPVRFDDIFPWGYSDEGVFTLVWPSGAHVERLTASTQAIPSELSPMAHGDLHYARGDFVAAQARYHTQALAPTDADLSQEARCKEAICLLGLKREEDAADILTGVAASPEGRWSAVAAFHLWLVLVRQKKLQEADALLALFQARFRFAELAALIPVDDRARILEAYHPKMSGQPYQLIKYDPTRVRDLERAATVEELFGASPLARAGTKVHLIEALEVESQDALAAIALKELLRAPNLQSVFYVWATRELAWMHMRQGEPDRALQVVNERLIEGAGVYRPDALPLLLTRASIYAARKEMKAANDDLELFLRQYPRPEDIGLMEWTQACLLRGFFREAAGDSQGALKAWKEGYLRVKGSPNMQLLVASMLASLSNELTEEDVHAIVAAQVPLLSNKSPVFNLTRSLLASPFPDLTEALRAMWRSPRGREYARNIVFLKASYSDYLGIQLPLTGAEFLRLGALPGELSPENDAIFWSCAMHMYEGFRSGLLNEHHLTQAYIAWYSYNGRIAWGGIASQLEKNSEFRAELAYIFGHRYRHKNWAGSADFFKTAVADSKPGSALRRLAEAELKKTGAK